MSKEKLTPMDSDKIFKIKDMTVYSEIVRIIGEQCHTISTETFYWTLALEDCEFVEIEIILTFGKTKTMFEIYEVEAEKQASKKIKHDLIYTLIGYACSEQIELKYNSYLHIEGKKL